MTERNQIKKAVEYILDNFEGTVEMFIDPVAIYAATAASAERVTALEHLLNHIHREVASLEDFDAGSLMEEIEQTLNGTKVFDDNKALWDEITRLKAANKVLLEFADSITIASGPYPELDGKPIVAMARLCIAKAAKLEIGGS